MLTSDGCPGFDEQNPFVDGGKVDRIGLKPWRDYCRARADLNASPWNFFNTKESNRVPDAVVHLISRSSPFSGSDDLAQLREPRFSTFYSQKSGMSFFDMGDYGGQMMDTCERASGLIERVEKEVTQPKQVFTG